MIPLSRIFPQTVGLTVGGELVMFAELRLADLAAIQQWIEMYDGHPVDAAIASGDPVAWMAGKKAKVVSWPPRWGDKSGEEIMATQAAWVVTILASMQRAATQDGKPIPTFDDAAKVGTSMTEDEARQARRVIYGTPAWQEAQRLLAPDFEYDDRDREPTDWQGGVAWLCKEYGYTPEQVGQMSLSQFRLLVSEGKWGRYKPLMESRSEPIEQVIRRDRIMWGLPVDDSEGEGAGGGEGG